LRVELADKRQALTDLAEHFGMRISGGKLGIDITGTGRPALPKPDFSKISNERLAQLEAMFLALEAEAAQGAETSVADTASAA